MRTKRTLTLITLVALAALTTFGIFRNTKPVQAQDRQPPPQAKGDYTTNPYEMIDGARISFGMVGITQGQTLRLSVANISDAICPCSRVVLTFRGPNGQLLRNRNGEVIRRSVELQPGESTSLDLNFDETRSPNGKGLRLRAAVTVIPPTRAETGDHKPMKSIVPTVAVINNANGRTLRVFHAPPHRPRAVEGRRRVRGGKAARIKSSAQNSRRTTISP